MAEKSKSLSDEFLSQLVAELDEETITAIILHGSYARGDAFPPYSDVDIVRIIQETSSLPRRKRYIWRDGYLISFSVVHFLSIDNGLRLPKRLFFASAESKRRVSF